MLHLPLAERLFCERPLRPCLHPHLRLRPTCLLPTPTLHLYPYHAPLPLSCTSTPIMHLHHDHAYARLALWPPLHTPLHLYLGQDSCLRVCLDLQLRPHLALCLRLSFNLTLMYARVCTTWSMFHRTQRWGGPVDVTSAVLGWAHRILPHSCPTPVPTPSYSRSVYLF